MFVTSTTYSGALGSLDAADMHCQSSASAAGLPGLYRAWLSDGTANASDRITGDGPWYTTGNELAFSSKVDLRERPSRRSSPSTAATSSAPGASGAWTGTDANGVATGEDCEGWTNATADALATTGTALAVDTGWGGGDSPLRCNAKAALICFEVL